jgi:hypothetical protein
LIKEIEMGGSDVCRVSGMGSTGEFGGIGDGSHNGVASPEDVNGAGPLWTEALYTPPLNLIRVRTESECSEWNARIPLRIY